MDHDNTQASGKHKLNVASAADAADQEDNNEIEVKLSENTFADCFFQQMEKFAGIRFGQRLFKRTDRALKVLEDTAKWSLPPDDNENERPSNWIVFLSLIVVLRVFRFGFSIVAQLIGVKPLTPKSMVRFLQITRRRLRAIRFQGLKTLRNKELNNMDPRQINSILESAGKLLNRAMCTPSHHQEAPTAQFVFQQAKRDFEDKNSSERPCYEKHDLNDLTVCEMLDIFAAEDSGKDSDYIPSENDDRGDISMTSNNTTTSADDSTGSITEQITNNNDADLNEESPNKEDVDENTEVKYHTIPQNVEESENLNRIESENTGTHTTEKPADLQISVENGESNGIMPLATPEAAPSQLENTPKSPINVLAEVSQTDESTNGLTAGRDATASLKNQSPNEIRTGSSQDLRSISHRTPIVTDGSNGEAKTSTPNEESVSEEDVLNVSSENGIPNQKKRFYHSSNNKHHSHQYYNAKNRNKNRH